MYRWTLWARLYYRLSLLPWLTLRALFSVAPRRTRFSQLPNWVLCADAAASLLVHSLFIYSAMQLRTWLPESERIGSALACLVGGLFVWGWLRRPLAAVIGVALIAVGFTADDPSIVALGAANVVAWRLLAWETREAHNVWQFKPIYLEAINRGSATVLRGKIDVHHVFLNTPRRRWRQRARLAALRKVERACRWIVRHAKSYRVPLEFEHTILNGSPVVYAGTVPTLENNYAELAAFEAFLAQVIEGHGMGQDGPSDEKKAISNECLVVHMAEYIGRSAYAVPRYRGQIVRLPQIEYTVVGPWKSAAVFAHELLHLFGANDLYHTGALSESINEARSRLLWRSIMFNCDTPLRQLAVDEQTAQCIGWL